MTPSAIAFNGTNTVSNGKHHAIKVPNTKTDTAPHLTSADAIRMEHEYGAHK